SVQCLKGNDFNFSTNDFVQPEQGVVEFEWDFGDGNTANIKDPSYTFGDTGTFNVRLKLFTKGHPECNDYEELLFDTIINIVESPNADFTVNQDTQCFASQEFLFDLGVPNMAGVTYEWNFGVNASTQNFSGTNPPPISFSSGGPQMIILKSGNKVCYGSDTIYPTVFTPPEPKFVSVQDGCGPLEVSFSNTTNPWMEVDWVWDFGDGISSIDENPVHTYTDSGHFSVTLLAVANGLCPGIYDSTFTSYIEVYPLPNAQFSIAQNGGPFGKTVELLDESLNGNVLYYDYGDGTPLTSLATHHYQNSGDYVIQQIMLNQYDCFDTARIEYFVKPYMTIFMPNSFTPNGDRINDVYLQKGFDLGYNVDTYELQVYTRWGEMIYSTFDINEGWDGITNTGRKAKLGVYVYKTIVKDFYSIIHEYTGTINLMR
ncbi:MAG: gliding motility-associated-like protein, partial [Flavobacteriales bacterium]